MPLNTLRLNHQQSTHPNDRIVFIKPLQRPPAQKDDYDRAELVLRAIAAQCLPIMKDHHLSVTTLEEHEANQEFIGRNFNNGEIIQLVIRSRSGAWLPLNMIQMVMMHELAHNTHMNHGKGFWQARNLYANEMRQLWTKGYTGEGFWGRGHTMESLQSDLGTNVVSSEELGALPLCGGTFRSRRKKRKAKSSDLTWKEQRDRRIEKKFGKNGVSLGEDEDTRLRLEINSKGPVGAKPRVAQSKRGRELRAAAALARFATNKRKTENQESVKQEEVEDSADDDEYEESDLKQEDATDWDGHKLLDSHGQGMIQVCEANDSDSVQVKNEIEELAGLHYIPMEGALQSRSPISILGKETDSLERQEFSAADDKSSSSKWDTRQELSAQLSAEATPSQTSPSSIDAHAAPLADKIVCGVCTMTNDAARSTCSVCAHVIDPRKDPKHWRCESKSCTGSLYINAGDYGTCALCGAGKPSATQDPEHSRSQPRAQPNDTSLHIAYT